MNRAYSILEIKAVKEDERLIEGIATTPTPDRYGDIIDPMGAQYTLPMPLLWQHKTSEPVGHVEFARPNKDGIPFKARVFSTETVGKLKDRLDEAWESVKLGLVRAVSIGFTIGAYEIMKEGGWRINEWEWLELSLVTIPANADCTITSVKSIDSELLAASGRKQNGGERTVKAGVTASRSTPVVKAEGAKRAMSKRTIAEAIASFEATVLAKKNEMSALMEKSIDSGESLSAEDQDKYDALKSEMDSAVEHVARLRAHDELNRSTATEVKGATAAEATASRTTSLPAQVRATPKPLGNGTGFVRFVQCLINAKGDVMMAERMAMQRANQWDVETPGVVECIKAAANLGHTKFDMELVTRAAVAAGSTTDSTWAGALVNYQILASEFIEYLRPLSIIGRIPGLRRVPFKVKVPRQTGGSSVGWVGERSVKPVSSLAFDTVTLEFAKIAGIIVISEELARFSNPSAESIIRQDLGDAIVQYMDSQFVDPTVAAVTNVSPASITNGVTAVTASGTTAAALRADLKNVLDNFLGNNIPLAGIVGIMTQSQALAISLMQTSLGTAAFPGLTAQGGSLAGIPIVTSENIPATGGSPTDGYPIVFLRARDILLADDGQVAVDASNQASLQMDTAPTSPPTGDTVPFSLWQHNCVGLRAERFINWAKGRSTAVEFIQNAKYAE